MRNEFKIVLLICTMLLVLACANPALEHFKQGATYRAQNQWDEAIAAYTRAIEADPDFAMAYNNRGHSYAMKREYNKAIGDFESRVERILESTDELDKIQEILNDKYYFPKTSLESEIDGSLQGGFRLCLEYFLRCILEDRSPEPSAEDGLKIVEIVEAIHQSLEKEKPITLNSGDNCQ